MTTAHAYNLKQKYEHYHNQGNLVLMVTLSTFVKSDDFAASDRMRHFWDKDFMYRVKKQLPERNQIWKPIKGRDARGNVTKFGRRLVDAHGVDHDFVVERSPAGYWHYHGLLAFEQNAGAKIWNDGALNRQLARDLDSFRYAGKHRSFRVNAYLIEPVRDGLLPEYWIRYSTKTHDYLSWTRDERAAVPHVSRHSSDTAYLGGVNRQKLRSLQEKGSAA